MIDLLTALGVTGIPALALIAVVWIVTQTVRRVSELQSARWASQLRLSEARFNAALEARTALDVDLRNRRVEVYGPLWAMGVIVSRWPKNDRLTYSDLQALHLKLKDWYFNQSGGLWLSSEARAAYGRLQEALDGLTAEGAHRVEPNGADYERVLNAYSNLRTELTEDLQSRVRPTASAAAQV